MGYRSLEACVDDLEKRGELRRVDAPIDPRLEAAEIQRRLYATGGPALLLTNPRDCKFPILLNLFGTIDRARWIFRDSFDSVRKLIGLKIDPMSFWRSPTSYFGAARSALSAIPKRCSTGPVLDCETTIDKLPNFVSWPDDGGPFITLPQVYSEETERPGLIHSNLGMYRVQLSGGEYELNRQVGLHYQIHRSIGVHHAQAIARGKPFRVNIFVGGPPAMSLAAVMPLPEGLSELMFAGALNRRRVRMIDRPGELPIHAEADFCITGVVEPNKLLPEGPFGDHLGYYSRAHDFPVLRVEKVYHRQGAIWPATVVGRPPQEDTIFGQLIHELAGPAIPAVLPGVEAVHAVDASGVHPLLLAIGSERYTPYQASDRPQELLTQANAILGQGQLSLAKYLWIANRGDDASLDLHHIGDFFKHMLARVDWRRDIHFQTETTIDTLDYTGSGLNRGSKAIIAAVGAPQRTLASDIPSALSLPSDFGEARVCQSGILAIRGPKYRADGDERDRAAERFCASQRAEGPLAGFPLIVIADDAEFAARCQNNWIWTVFTRSDPARDVHGIESFTHDKHWGCRGPLVIDARIKPHHAPPLVEDPEVTRKVDSLARQGGPLAGLFD